MSSMRMPVGPAKMKLERPAVDAGEEIPTQPRNQDRQRTKGGCKECKQENRAVMETALQQPAIPVTKASRMTSSNLC